MKKIIGLIVLMVLLIPFNVSAKDYNVILSYFAEGGIENTGNIEVYNNLVFEKDGYNAEVTYKSTDTINYINSLDKKTTFTLKKNNKAQTKNKEWYGKKYTDSSKVYFSNSEKYTVKDLIKKLEIDTDYYSDSGESIEVFLYANYSNTKVTKVEAKSIELNTNKKEIGIGESYTFTPTITPSGAEDTKITWKSSNDKVATVSSNGKVIGVKKGTVTITATTSNKVKATAKIEVVKKSGDYVYFVDVTPSSDSSIIESNGHYGLIDTGIKDDETKLVNRLKELGVKELDFILLTHAHSDHIGGYKKVMNSFKVKTLYFKTVGAKVDNPYQKKYKNIIEIANDKNTKICDVKSTKCQSFKLGDIDFKLYNTGFYIAKEVLTQEEFEDHGTAVENLNSTGAVANINGRKVYFPGDIGNWDWGKAEDASSLKVGDIDVYKAAHHGYAYRGNQNNNMEILKPEYAIISNKRGWTGEKYENRNKYLKKGIRHIEKSHAGYKKTYYTYEGMITLKIDSDGQMHFYQ